MRRVGALLGAAAMVVVALWIRGAVDGDEERGDDAAAGDVVVCPEELAESCAVLDGARTAPMGTIADELIAAADPGELDASVWVVPSAWARLVVDERARTGGDPILEVQGGVLASSPVLLAVWADAEAELAGRCPDVGWPCLAEEDGAPLDSGGRVRSGMPPVDSVAGLLVAAEQAGALLGTSGYAANDFDGPFRSAIGRLAAGQQADPLGRMRSRGPGELTAAGVLTADAGSRTSNFGAIRAVEDPGDRSTARADLVVLSTTGNDLDPDDRDRLGAALREAGWSDPAAGPDGLPAGSVLAALRTLWNES